MYNDFRMKMTTQMVATMFNVSERRVRQIAKERGVKPQRLGQMLLFTKTQVERMRTRKTKPGPRKNGRRR